MGYDWSVPWADASSVQRRKAERYGTIISPSSPIGNIRETGDKESDRHNPSKTTRTERRSTRRTGKLARKCRELNLTGRWHVHLLVLFTSLPFVSFLEMVMFVKLLFGSMSSLPWNFLHPTP